MALAKLKENTLSTLLQAGAAHLEERGVPSPRLEAELLLSQLLALRRIDLYLAPDRPISPGEEALFWERLRRRGAREPLQYILGKVEFCGMTLEIQPGVFIPRPETELMVEAVGKVPPAPARILDLCTGSGALALALAQRFPSSKVAATDCSERALTVARSNRTLHQLTARVALLQGDLFEPLKAGARFDLIVCNPPYIPEKDRAGLQPEVRDYEPSLALYAAENGTAFYRRILREAPAYLAPGGRLILELGAGQSGWLRDFAKRETSFGATLIQDFAGMDRIALLQRRPGAPNG